ncbi:MAG TPA: hypothetical protein VKB87_06810 [Myxococcaceae bacterium]|nr:hypothetical protein [Myxococcaceae bacterium]
METDPASAARAPGEIDIAACATVAYSSEDRDHPVENLFDGHSGPGGTRWLSARPDTIERIVVEFDHPQTISRLVYEVEETVRERTQQCLIDAGYLLLEDLERILAQSARRWDLLASAPDSAAAQ